MKQTPLFHHHQQLNARMVDFSGWSMPVQYNGVLAEHLAVRNSAGLFDVSHMGEFEFRGPDALLCLQTITANDVSSLQIGQAQYSLLLNEHAGIIDDIIVYRLAPDHFLMVVNAGNLDTDWHWIMAHRQTDVEITNISDTTALIALQGPKAQKILQPLTTAPLSDLGRFRCLKTMVGSAPATIARTGYTGEDGFEIFVANHDAGQLWTTLLAQGQPEGMLPCGLAARDTLRLEMAYPLHGHEITAKTTPVAANLMWVVKLNKNDFIGKEALLSAQQQNPDRKLIGFVMEDPGIPRAEFALLNDHRPVGFVTSGTMSPSLKIGIGMGFLPPELATIGSNIWVDIRGKERLAKIVQTPFYKKGKTK